jgi:CelD/BcsL family acetyltransferase involved in cellulose biosynthesis
VIDVTVIETPEEAADLAVAWDSLVAGGASSIYTSPAWSLAAWRHFPDSGAPFLVVAFDGEVLVGALPLTRAADGLTWAGSPLGDEHDARVHLGGSAGPVAAALADAVRDRSQLLTRVVLTDSRTNGALSAALPAGRGCPAPVLPLASPDGEFGPLASIPGWSRDRRRALRTARERLTGLGDVTIEYLMSPDRLAPALPQFVAARLNAWATRGRLDDLPAADRHSALPGFLTDVACQLGKQGRCLLARLYCDGQPVAQSLFFRTSDAYLWYMSTFDPTMGRYSPSHLLLAEVAAHAVSEGIRLIELGRGDEPYKFDHGAVPRHLSDVEVTGP